MAWISVASGVVVAWAALLAGRSLLLSWSAHRAANHEHRRHREALLERLQQASSAAPRSRASATAWQGPRKLVVQRKIREGEGICSFHLVPQDGKGLPPFRPGQFLTFDLRLPDTDSRLVRCYSLSDAPDTERYRVTIKKIPPPDSEPGLPSGRSSSFFVDSVNEGDTLDVRAPRGAFYLNEASHRTAVFVAGGIGVTPLHSMFRSMARGHSEQNGFFFHGVRDSSEHALRDELREIARDHPRLKLLTCYSRPLPGDVAGLDYDREGRIDVDWLQEVLPCPGSFPDAEFYICGPGPLMKSMTEGLAEWGVPEPLIHFEAFGPASIRETSARGPARTATNAGSRVRFARSGKTAIWSVGIESLLDLAEQTGVAIDSGCRAGNCGTCETRLQSGTVTYEHPPEAEAAPGNCLACVAVPNGDIVLDA
jgi:hypothetical protein